jgi:hypothetical protein
MSAAVISNDVFLEAMFEDAAPGTYTIITAFLNDPTVSTPRDWAGWPWSPGQRIPRYFRSHNAYLTVSAFEPDARTGESRRRKAQFHALHAVMIDDLGTKVDDDKLRLPPSVMLETSPGNKQAYLFVAQDIDAQDRLMCERLIDEMVAHGLTTSGLDPGMKGVTRYGRLPVGINNKAKYVEKLGHPFKVRCEVFEPTRRYTVAEIAAAWQLDLSKREPQRKVISITPEIAAMNDRRFAAMLQAFQILGTYKGRIGAGPWHEIMCPWVHEHTGKADSGAALAEPNAENNFQGGFRCHHGHGPHLGIGDVREVLRRVRDALRRQQQ